MNPVVITQRNVASFILRVVTPSITVIVVMLKIEIVQYALHRSMRLHVLIAAPDKHLVPTVSMKHVRYSLVKTIVRYAKYGRNQRYLIVCIVDFAGLVRKVH